jgi:hypothetical protein
MKTGEQDDVRPGLSLVNPITREKKVSILIWVSGRLF